MAEQTSRTLGVVGLYDSADDLIRAAAKVRDSGFKKWDCHTPYPVHGLDQAMGMKESPVPYVTLGTGLVGLLVAVALTGGLSALHYPIRIGGKALFSWQAFVPIYFELFVLFASIATMGSVVFFCRLGRWHSPLHVRFELLGLRRPPERRNLHRRSPRKSEGRVRRRKALR